MELTPELTGDYHADVNALLVELKKRDVLLVKLRDAGPWFMSALEIDEYRDNRADGDGEQLFAEIVAIVGPVPSDEPEVTTPRFNWD